MNDNDIRRAFEAFRAGTDPDRARDAVQRAVAAESETKQTVRKERSMKKRIRWTAVIAAAALVAILGAAVAAAPMIRNYLNTLSLQEDSVGPLTEVPEGWIGIYTLDELDAVRDRPTEFYILMEDLSFDPADFEAGGRFEGGWEPIGTYKKPFTGIFNGNGHTIDGLRVEVSEIAEPPEPDVNRALGAGLFGYAAALGNYRIETRTEWVLTGEEDERGNPVFEEREVTDKVYDYEDNQWGRGGLIKNLRLTNASVRVLYSPVEFIDLRPISAGKNYAVDEYYKRITAYAGTIAGYADYVLGCAAEGCTVEFLCAGDEIALECAEYYGTPVEDFRDSTTIYAGGVTGSSYLIDSCFADTRIVTRESEVYPAPGSYIGGLSGLMSACVTSYFDGTVEGDLGDGGIGAIRTDDVPRILPADVMDELVIRLAFLENLSYQDGVFTGKVYPDDYEEMTNQLRRDGVTADTLLQYEAEHSPERSMFKAVQFFCYYVKAEPGKETINFETVQNLVTQELSEQPVYVLDPTIKPRESQTLRISIKAAFPDGDFGDFCRENNVKYGCYYGYDLRSDPDCAFEGFDFGAIWSRDGDGLPVLRLFR